MNTPISKIPAKIYRRCNSFLNNYCTIAKILPKSSTINNFCTTYNNKYNNENNASFETNGELRILQKNLPHCKMIFDIGANVGDWTKSALSINQNLSIHCFEPSKATYNILIKNTFPQSILCNNFGISSKKESKDLYIFSEGAGTNSLYIREGLELSHNLKPQSTRETIQLNTIDNYCAEKNISKVDFMKIDIEGHELEAFKGGINLFKKSNVDIIQFEYGGCNIDSRVFLKDIFDFFRPMNYSFYKIYPERAIHAKQYEQKFENFQYQNWLIVNNNYKNFVP